MSSVFTTAPEGSSPMRASEIVAAPYAREAIATPCLTGAHLRKDLLRLGFHPVCETLFVLAKIVSQAQDGQTEPTSIPLVGIKIDKVVYVRQGVRLDAHYTELLPREQVILIRFSPPLKTWRQRLPADLNRQKLLLCAEGCSSDEAVT